MDNLSANNKLNSYRSGLQFIFYDNEFQIQLHHLVLQHLQWTVRDLFLEYQHIPILSNFAEDMIRQIFAMIDILVHKHIYYVIDGLCFSPHTLSFL